MDRIFGGLALIPLLKELRLPPVVDLFLRPMLDGQSANGRDECLFRPGKDNFGFHLTSFDVLLCLLSYERGPPTIYPSSLAYPLYYSGLLSPNRPTLRQ